MSVIVVELNTGSYRYSAKGISLSSKNSILDMAFDKTTGNIFILVENNYLLPNTGKITVVSTLQISSTYYAYFSSTLSQQGKFYLIMANSTGYFLFNFDTRSTSIAQGPAPYGFVGAVYNEKTQQLLGNVLTSYNGTNVLTYINPQSGNATTAGQPLYQVYCGATINHAALDYTSNTYYTLCCTDNTFCSNPAVTAINVADNSIKRSTLISDAQRVMSGYYWIS